MITRLSRMIFGCHLDLIPNVLKEDHQIIVGGKFLSDKHINFAQRLIKMQNSNIGGLLCTLNFSKRCFKPFTEPAIQMIHTRGNHWIVVSTIESTTKISVYDTLYLDLEKDTRELILYMFGNSTCNIIKEDVQ
uniref:Ubiquitin-like protease family profile domain-containing protein n=1 Tax=Amphimedon queenslandica TaxID=400682 RepID=A0A1X7TYG5_AMPQE